jgi:hypothetical protein
MTGGIFMITGIIGQSLSARFTMTLGKFLMVASFAFIFFMIIMMLVAFLGGSAISEK